MSVSYDKYYQTESLFGEPYPELIEFFSTIQAKGKVLDLGCGQGRDAIPLARLRFDVTGIDNSKVGIEQMNQFAQNEDLNLNGIVADVFKFEGFNEYDYVLLDSMFHFAKNDLDRETKFIKRIIKDIRKGTLIIFCIQDSGKKIEILHRILNNGVKVEQVLDQKFKYTFQDETHQSVSNYRLIVVKKE